jgi:hypothetical protein
MRICFMSSLAALAAVLAFWPVALAQTDHDSAAAKADTKSQSFDSHDLTGVWNLAPKMQPKDEPPIAIFRAFTAKDLLPPFTPWGEAQFQANAKFIAAGDVLDCDPLGTARNFFVALPFEIFQTRDRMLVHYEFSDNWREIWTDGRKIPADADPEYMGYSVGRWEGDTFVVDSGAYNGKTFLTGEGFPMSESMRQTERWQRVDEDTLKILFTFDDPKAYAKPWTVTAFFKLKRNWALYARPCTISGIKLWDKNIGHPDGLPGLDYKPQK